MTTDTRQLTRRILIGAAVVLAAAPVLADQCILDDLIVDGSTCIGFDCVCNGENFGFDTLRLKENNLRITFIDTSVAASYPRGDWQIRANESTNGGANEFAVDWLGTTATSGGALVSTPFAIEGGAPDNALYVDDGGRVGFGTSVPSLELHVVDGDSPALRLAQDGSAGFAPQTWDVAGNETNFFVRDVTNGSQLPFRIRPDAPSSSIFIEGTTGDVGIGTSSPVLDVHIVDTEIPGMRLDDTDDDVVWDFRMETNQDFLITQGGTGGAEFIIADGTLVGNARKFTFGQGPTVLMEIQADGDVNSSSGSFGTISDRSAKTDIRPVEPRAVLAKLSALPISTWRYKANPDELHMGPMGQDFWAAFGLHEGPRTVSLGDLSGVALAAVQGLAQELGERDATIRRQDAAIRQLLARVEALEARLGE